MIFTDYNKILLIATVPLLSTQYHSSQTMFDTFMSYHIISYHIITFHIAMSVCCVTKHYYIDYDAHDAHDERHSE